MLFPLCCLSAGHKHPVTSCIIGEKPQLGKTSFSLGDKRKYFAYSLALVGTDFHEKQTTGHQQVRKFLTNPPDDLKPPFAAIKREQRLMSTHLRLQIMDSG